MSAKRRMFERLRVFGDLTGNYTGHIAEDVITNEHIELNGELQPGFHDCRCCDNTMALPPDPYATLGQQIRAELDREAEAVAYLEARGYKVIKKEGA